MLRADDAMLKPTPIRLAIGSILIGLVVLALKFWAAEITGSVALLSDALESIVNVVAAFAALIAVRLAARPADATLPYGYHKAEYFSAVLEGVFILIAALAIFYQAWQAIANPRPITLDVQSAAIVLLATAINGAWCAVLIGQGRKLRSPAIEADGHHLWTDVLSSLGVIVGLTAALLTGWMIRDALIAGLVGLYILGAGSLLVARSVGGLMDAALPSGTSKPCARPSRPTPKGRSRLMTSAPGGRGPRPSSSSTSSCREMSVETAHEICDRIEAALGRNRWRPRHHPCRARAQGQAFGHRGRVTDRASFAKMQSFDASRC